MSLKLVRFSSQKQWLCLLIVAAVCLLLVEFIEFPGHIKLWRWLQNAAHIPFFGLVALVSLLVLSSVKTSALAPQHVRYGLALLVTVLIGAAIEFRQIFIQRDASLLDLVYDTLGGVLFLSAYAAYQRDAFDLKSQRLIKALMALSLTGVVAALSPIALLSASMVYRSLNFPVINSFDSVWEYSYLSTMNSNLSLSNGLPRWQNHNSLLKLEFQQGRYKGVWVEEPQGDWAKYDSLNFNIYSDYESAFTMHLRIHDNKHSYRYIDRFNRALPIKPGENSFRIPMEDIRNAPKGRKMQMQGITAIGLFTSDRRLAGQTIWIDNIVLQ